MCSILYERWLNLTCSLNVRLSSKSTLVYGQQCIFVLFCYWVLQRYRRVRQCRGRWYPEYYKITFLSANSRLVSFNPVISISYVVLKHLCMFMYFSGFPVIAICVSLLILFFSELSQHHEKVPDNTKHRIMSLNKRSSKILFMKRYSDHEFLINEKISSPQSNTIF